MSNLTPNQIVAINWAIRLLGDSPSDHAEQTVYHLKQINTVTTPCYQCGKPVTQLSHNSRCMSCMNERDIANQKFIDGETSQ